MKIKGEVLTQERLKEVMHYSPESGVFTWRIRAGVNIKKGSIAGTVKKNDYVYIVFKCRDYFAHRLAWLYVYGQYPAKHIDHINGIKHDNRLVNLREVDHIENQKNARRPITNTSGISGVAWNVGQNKWVARITADRKLIHLGTFGNKFDAACARKSAERKYGFHLNYGRDY